MASNLTQRTITGLIGAAVMLFAIVYSYNTLYVLAFLLQTLTVWECYQLFNKGEKQPFVITGTLISVGYFIYLWYHPAYKHHTFPAYLLAGGFGLVWLQSLFSHRSNPIESMVYTVLPWIYITIPFALLLEVPYLSTISYFKGYRYEIIISIFFLIWANDIGAYFVGKSIGKHKLFERISPKKTWEGSIGGLLSAILIAILLYSYWGLFSFTEWIGLTIITVVFGSLGDLVESQLKRVIGVKDSGTLLPGHGGFLDRFDAFLFALPFVYIYLQFLSRGL
ncbi:MAG: phosphatidate cytidylyltransferase [Cytophagaceae bacterium]